MINRLRPSLDPGGKGVVHEDRSSSMKRIALVIAAIATAAAAVVCLAPAPGRAAGEAAPVFVTKIPAGYRDWKLVSVAHEEGETKDIRAILANDKGIKAFREAKLPFPEGTII